MANNRMYLHCTVCHKEVYLAKYFPSTGWYLSHPELTSMHFIEHAACLGPDAMTNPIFTLQYEVAAKAPKPWSFDIEEYTYSEVTQASTKTARKEFDDYVLQARAQYWPQRTFLQRCLTTLWKVKDYLCVLHR